MTNLLTVACQERRTAKLHGRSNSKADWFPEFIHKGKKKKKEGGGVKSIKNLEIKKKCFCYPQHLGPEKGSRIQSLSLCWLNHSCTMETSNCQGSGSAIKQSQFVQDRPGNLNWRSKRNCQELHVYFLTTGWVQRLLMANLCCPLKTGACPHWLQHNSQVQSLKRKQKTLTRSPFASLLHNCACRWHHA